MPFNSVTAGETSRLYWIGVSPVERTRRARNAARCRWGGSKPVPPVLTADFAIEVVRYHLRLCDGRPGLALMLAKLDDVERWFAEQVSPVTHSPSAPGLG